MSSIIFDRRASVYKRAPYCFQALKVAENSKFEVNYLLTCCVRLILAVYFAKAKEVKIVSLTNVINWTL